MAASRAFALNFDAEHELAQPHGYQPSQGVVARFATLATRLGNLLGTSDVIVTHDTAADSLVNYRGVCWCPTPRALAELRRVGASVPSAPTLDVLQRVHDRSLGVELDEGPLPSTFVRSIEEAEAAIARSGEAHEFIAKRAFSFAGRGHRTLTSVLSQADRRFLQNSFALGHGVVIEPKVTRLLDCSLHGLIEQHGNVHFGRAVVQECDDQGVWRGLRGEHTSTFAIDLRRDEEAQLLHAAQGVAKALQGIGYFGPFGIDAFRYQTADGQEMFRPLVEINARLTMGFFASGLAGML